MTGIVIFVPWITREMVRSLPDARFVFGDKSLFPSADEFARQDGFRDYDDMHRWFTERYNDAYFVGRLTR